MKLNVNNIFVIDLFVILNNYLSNYIKSIRTGDPNENNNNYWMLSYDFKTVKKDDFMPEESGLRKEKDQGII